eukprot:200718_1
MATARAHLSIVFIVLWMTPYLTISGKYIFVEQKLSSLDASTFCQNTYGTHLASIHSATDNYEAGTLCQMTPNCISSSCPNFLMACHIGLNDKENERGTDKSGWVWEDGSAYDFQRWRANEPSNVNGQMGVDCVAIHPTTHPNVGYTLTWNDLSCKDYQLYFLCNAPPTAHPTEDPTKHPTLSTKHPTQSPTIPTRNPSNNPTQSPTFVPTMDPTFRPTFLPTMNPTLRPTFVPTQSPTWNPSMHPSLQAATTRPSRVITSQSPTNHVVETSTTDEDKSDEYEDNQSNNEQQTLVIILIIGIVLAFVLMGIIVAFWHVNRQKEAIRKAFAFATEARSKGIAAMADDVVQMTDRSTHPVQLECVTMEQQEGDDDSDHDVVDGMITAGEPQMDDDDGASNDDDDLVVTGMTLGGDLAP